MSTDQLPFFLALAQEWRTAADVLRARRVAETDPTLGVWREAAWCHLMFARGRHAAAVVRLPAVVRAVTGVSIPVPRPADRDGAVSAAVDLFALLRTAVSARFPTAFGFPVAA